MLGVVYGEGHLMGTVAFGDVVNQAAEKARETVPSPSSRLPVFLAPPMTLISRARPETRGQSTQVSLQNTGG